MAVPCAVRAAILAFALISLSYGQLVTIADDIFLADGSRATGTATISWKQFVSGGGQTIGAGSKEVQFFSGIFRTTLEATTSAIPAGLSYTVKFRVDNTVWTEFWVVPTGGPHDIPTVRVVSAPDTTLMFLLSQLLASGATTGQVPVYDGSSWIPGTIGAGSGLNCTNPQLLTLDSGGGISILGNGCYLVDTFSAASSDDLTAVNCTQGQRFIFLAADAARTVTVKKTTGIEVQADFSLDSLYDAISLVCLATNTAVELGRSNGGD